MTLFFPFPILFCSILFYSLLSFAYSTTFNSTLFYFTLLYSIPFLFHSALFYTIMYQSASEDDFSSLFLLFFHSPGEKLSLKDLTAVMKSMDDNNNGTISFDEFTKGVYEFVVKSKSLSEKRQAWVLIACSAHTRVCAYLNAIFYFFLTLSFLNTLFLSSHSFLFILFILLFFLLSSLFLFFFLMSIILRTQHLMSRRVARSHLTYALQHATWIDWAILRY